MHSLNPLFLKVQVLTEIEELHGKVTKDVKVSILYSSRFRLSLDVKYGSGKTIFMENWSQSFIHQGLDSHG